MVAVTRGIGAALIVVGIVGFAVSGAEHLTALLPSLLGLIVLGLGLLAGKEQFHRNAIHGALVVALLGFLGTVPRALPLLTGGEADPVIAAWASLITAVLTLVYVVLGIRSFIAARRARETAASR